MTVPRMAFVYYFNSPKTCNYEHFQKKHQTNQKNNLRKTSLLKNVLDSFMTSKTECFLGMDLSLCLYITRFCSNVYNLMARRPKFAFFYLYIPTKGILEHV